MGKLLSKFKKKVLDDDDKELTPAELKENEFQDYMLENHTNILKVGGKRISKEIVDHALRAIAENNEAELRHHLNSYKISLAPEKYEWKECLCFWLAVHLKRFEIAQFLVENNIVIKKLVYTATTSFIPKKSDDSSEQKGIFRKSGVILVIYTSTLLPISNLLTL
jgi:hypothetical protein